MKDSGMSDKEAMHMMIMTQCLALHTVTFCHCPALPLSTPGFPCVSAEVSGHLEGVRRHPWLHRGPSWALGCRRSAISDPGSGWVGWGSAGEGFQPKALLD